MSDRRVLLVIGGGIAAYKTLMLIRRLREKGIDVRVVMTEAAKQFVTPLAAATLSENTVHADLFDLTRENEIGHIRLARDTGIVVVAPATADLMARAANGLANDLASAVLLATDKPVLMAPAMNPAMWAHPATKRNLETLKADGIAIVGPERGEMAERGEAGLGRMAEPEAILAAIFESLEPPGRPLSGQHVLVTAGPTHEPIDPVRYIANWSSGKQGYAIAAAAARAGAQVTLVSGPVALDCPRGVRRVMVESARDMLAAVETALPADVAVMTAAVADWRVDRQAGQKIKKQPGSAPPPLALALSENPDILATVAKSGGARPSLVVGFAAETENVVEHAKAKRQRKGCDWIVANDVSPESGVMGGDRNTVHLITADGVDTWPDMAKDAVAEKLVAAIAEKLRQ
jgi:phosphopantothenoylcysteine decarboxylase/phosphopantothenate--cysteine ligase